MPKTAQKQVNPQNLPVSNTPLIVKTVVITVLVIFAGAALFYAGYKASSGNLLLKKRSDSDRSETRQKSNEVPYGDEDLDKDPAYQKAMREEVSQPEEAGLVFVPFTDEKIKFSFNFPPSEVFLEKSDRGNLPAVFMDTKLIVVPQAYGGPLTPVEIRVPPLINYRTLDEAVTSSKEFFVAGSVKETKVSSPYTGVRLRGTAEVYGNPEGPYERVLIKANNGIIVIDFWEGKGFSREIFERILATFKVL